jgi:hypothetical protein
MFCQVHSEQEQSKERIQNGKKTKLTSLSIPLVEGVGVTERAADGVGVAAGVMMGVAVDEMGDSGVGDVAGGKLKS